MKPAYRNIVLLLIALISFFMHYSHFSKDLMSIHVWRQTQTQSTIINFYEEDMNLLNPRRNDRGDTGGIFRMEFPLMQWMVAGLYRVFGNHLIITRLFMFFIGLLAVLGMYRLLYELSNQHLLALFGAWAFNFSPSFFYHTINPMPDIFALCSSIWGIALFFHWTRNQKNSLLFLSGLLLAIGTMSKLPFILYFTVPVFYFAIKIYRQGYKKQLINQLFKITGFVALPFIWYVSVIAQWHGNGVVKGVLDNQVSVLTMMDYLQFNLISTLPELLLGYASVLFFIAGFYFLFKNKLFKNPLFPIFLIWGLASIAYYLFEINMIAKVHDYYLFPFYPLLFILVAYGAYNIFQNKQLFAKVITIIMLLALPVTTSLRMANRWNPDSPGFNKDLLVYKDSLRDAVPKNSLCIAGNDNSHFIFFYYIDKKGWGFHANQINTRNLKDMISRGAEYLYSDSREVDTATEIQKYLDSLVLETGSIRVFRLKNE
jgi:uncharacterized membrane protein YhaH (DUF805 family)